MKVYEHIGYERLVLDDPPEYFCIECYTSKGFSRRFFGDFKIYANQRGKYACSKCGKILDLPREMLIKENMEDFFATAPWKIEMEQDEYTNTLDMIFDKWKKNTKK